MKNPNAEAKYLQAGRLDESAETAQGIPKLVSAPLMIPQGRYRYMFVVCADGSTI